MSFKDIDLHDPEELANPLRKQHPYLMFDAITSIPEAAKACLEEKHRVSVKKAVDEIVNRKLDHIYLVGCGTSYNVARGLAPAFEQICGIRAKAIDGLEYILYPPPDLGQKTIVLAVSHSGGSLPTRRAVELSNSKGSLTLCLTGVKEGLLAQMVDIAIVDPYEREIPRPKTRSYFISLFQGFLIAYELGKKINNCCDYELADVIEKVSLSVKDSQAIVKNIAANWKDDVKHYLLAGSGLDSATSYEIALKMMEAFGYPAVGFDLEEFTHGPGYSLNSSSGVIILHSSSRTLPRSLEAANAVNHTKARLLVITSDPDAAWPKNADLIPIPKMDNLWGGFISIVPAQFFVYFMSDALGQNPDLAMNDHPEIAALSKTMFPPNTH